MEITLIDLPDWMLQQVIQRNIPYTNLEHIASLEMNHDEIEADLRQSELSLLLMAFEDKKNAIKYLYLPKKYRKNLKIIQKVLVYNPDLFDSLAKKIQKLIIKYKFIYEKKLKIKIQYSDVLSIYLDDTKKYKIKALKLKKLESSHLNKKYINYSYINDLIRNNVSNSIKYINQNKKQYLLNLDFQTLVNCKYKFNDYGKPYSLQKKYENRYIYDYLSSISNLFFSFNNLLINLLYNYCTKNNINYFSYNDPDFEEERKNIFLNYKNTIFIPAHIENSYLKQKELLSTIDHFSFCLTLGSQLIILGKLYSKINQLDNTVWKRIVKIAQILSYKKKTSFNLIRGIISTFVNYKIAIINDCIKNISNELNELKKKHKKKTVLTYTIQDLFHLRDNKNSISTILDFFESQNIIPTFINKQLTFYEIFFRHQFAHGWVDFLRNF